MKGKILMINLRNHLISAAERGIPVKIKTPFYDVDRPQGISHEEAEAIYKEMKAAGDSYFKYLDDLHGKAKR